MTSLIRTSDAAMARQRDYRFRVQSSILPKLDEDRSSDAHAEDPAKGIFVIADGATQSGYGDDWAQMLVRHACSFPPSRDSKICDWLQNPRRSWPSSVKARQAGKQLAWHMRSGERTIAASTLLVLMFERQLDGDLHWHAAIVGDTCLFWLRGFCVLGRYPFRHSSEFSSHPEVLFSADGRPDGSFRWEQGKAQAGDMFFLATDGLAKWLLEQEEKGDPRWDAMAKCLDRSDSRAFQKEMDNERMLGRMMNDDITLVMISVVRTPCPPEPTANRAKTETPIPIESIGYGGNKYPVLPPDTASTTREQSLASRPKEHQAPPPDLQNDPRGLMHPSSTKTTDIHVPSSGPPRPGNMHAVSTVPRKAPALHWAVGHVVVPATVSLMVSLGTSWRSITIPAPDPQSQPTLNTGGVPTAPAPTASHTTTGGDPAMPRVALTSMDAGTDAHADASTTSRVSGWVVMNARQNDITVTIPKHTPIYKEKKESDPNWGTIASVLTCRKGKPNTTEKDAHCILLSNEMYPSPEPIRWIQIELPETAIKR